MHKALKKIRHYNSALGPLGAAAFLLAKLTGTHPLFKTTVAGIRHPIYVRIGTTDTSVLGQVLVEKHYELPFPIAPKVIVDAGANIGLSAVYFANKYPGATIVAIEPEASNFLVLQKNVSPYPRIQPLCGALWSENKQISLIDPHSGHHGFQTVETPGNSHLVQAMTMDALMTKMGVEFVDVLKIDIEGAEKEVFEGSEKWMRKVGLVMAESHDHLKPGCRKAFLEATKEFSREFLNGETVVRMRTVANQGLI